MYIPREENVLRNLSRNPLNETGRVRAHERNDNIFNFSAVSLFFRVVIVFVLSFSFSIVVCESSLFRSLVSTL